MTTQPYTPTQTESTDPPPAPVAAAADWESRRRRTRLALLGAIAPLGRWGLALAERGGVTTDHFAGDDDALAIFAALEVASNRGAVTNEAKLLYCRRALEWAGAWDLADERSFIGGPVWGPGMLSALFTRIGRADAEAAIPRLAADLLAFDAEWDSLCRRAWREGAAA